MFVIYTQRSREKYMIRKLLVASVMSIAASNAFATGQTWDFGSAGQPTYADGNSLTLNNDGIQLTVSAWASTGNTCSPYSNSYANDGTDPSNDVDPCIRSANLRNYSGNLGIINEDEQSWDYGDYNWENGHLVRNTHQPDDEIGQHAIDNIQNLGGSHKTGNDYDHEMVLLSFSESVSLTEISKGWSFSDNDFSALVYNSSDPFTSIQNSTWHNLVTDGGWDVVDNGSLKPSSLLNTASTYSKYWLVGAYNSIFNGVESDHNDAFKLNGLKTVKYVPPTGGTNVSSPATLGMFAFFVALVVLRKRTAK